MLRESDHNYAEFVLGCLQRGYTVSIERGGHAIMLRKEQFRGYFTEYAMSRVAVDQLSDVQAMIHLIDIAQIRNARTRVNIDRQKREQRQAAYTQRDRRQTP